MKNKILSVLSFVHLDLPSGRGELDDGNMVPCLAVLQPVPWGVEEEEERPPQHYGRPGGGLKVTMVDITMVDMGVA